MYSLADTVKRDTTKDATRPGLSKIRCEKRSSVVPFGDSFFEQVFTVAKRVMHGQYFGIATIALAQ